MGLLELFIASSIPVLKVLLVTGLGTYLALDRVDILGEAARKHVNNVNFFNTQIHDFFHLFLYYESIPLKDDICFVNSLCFMYSIQPLWPQILLEQLHWMASSSCEFNPFVALSL